MKVIVYIIIYYSFFYNLYSFLQQVLIYLPDDNYDPYYYIFHIKLFNLTVLFNILIVIYKIDLLFVYILILF